MRQNYECTLIPVMRLVINRYSSRRYVTNRNAPCRNLFYRTCAHFCAYGDSISAENSVVALLLSNQNEYRGRESHADAGRLDPLSSTLKMRVGEKNRTNTREFVVYTLKGVMEICRLLMVVQFCPTIKSRAIANYRQSDRSWNRSRANLGHFIPC